MHPGSCGNNRGEHNPIQTYGEYNSDTIKVANRLNYKTIQWMLILDWKNTMSKEDIFKVLPQERQMGLSYCFTMIHCIPAICPQS